MLLLLEVVELLLGLGVAIVVLESGQRRLQCRANFALSLS